MKKTPIYFLFGILAIFSLMGCDPSTKVKKPEHLARANQIFNVTDVDSTTIQIYSFPYKDGELIVNSQGGIYFIRK